MSALYLLCELQEVGWVWVLGCLGFFFYNSSTFMSTGLKYRQKKVTDVLLRYKILSALW